MFSNIYYTLCYKEHAIVFTGVLETQQQKTQHFPSEQQ